MNLQRKFRKGIGSYLRGGNKLFILWFFWAPSLFCYYIHFLGFEMVVFFFFFGVNSQMSISWDNDIKYLTLSCFLFIALHYVNVHIPNTIISIYSSPYSINLPHAVSLVRFQKWFFFGPFEIRVLMRIFVFILFSFFLWFQCLISACSINYITGGKEVTV